MLNALMSGRAMTATQLAQIANITASTASGHLAKLTQGGLLLRDPRGRHRYFRLASASVARMLEDIMVVAGESAGGQNGAQRSPVNPALRQARTCYDHLAGRLGVALKEALHANGMVDLDREGGELTQSGRQFLSDFGVSFEGYRATRPLFRLCLDWTERRQHVAGTLGAALLKRILELDWIRHFESGRAVYVTPNGHKGFLDRFGIRL